MDILIALLVGILIGGAITYSVSRRYEVRIKKMQEQHREALKKSKNRSIDGSRAVIKGKIAEQFAPLLPGFDYLPSDARFIGDPIDYIVFNGYTDLKDNGGDEDDLELVVVDIKTGKASLSATQQAIARAIRAGRVRFEVIRPDTSAPQGDRFPQLPSNHSPKGTQKHLSSDDPWTRTQNERLRQRYRQGITVEALADEFQREPSEIRNRLKKLGLRL
jgi:predicted Holliday junction resolvase-like endonuclease